ncbi:hypothetical protein SARC_06701 [Sphaeroforma arctica JP610]|uniref:Uncharacterized protein n=1 Tax=Sphaeroforma arctica JP610 TaxID=667725 RepID=A0A0L0FVT8_9EUKA|nr:hypothetical protein SARC_06701 [Sphaeroforma arctica JP610]KNC80952.1 hypothetical protein SARC_06701 [Sphaeroforma arctica JP610]|eukprot:XP_014154854.1 hypothetical protein SARC_06701 [Sphaeroforma arctica JP610]
MRRTRDVAFPCLRETKDIAFKKRQKRWNDSKKIVEFEVGDIVNIMARNSDTTVLTAKYIGPIKMISVADKKIGTYGVINVDGSSALNIGHIAFRRQKLSFVAHVKLLHLLCLTGLRRFSLSTNINDDMTHSTMKFEDGVQYDLSLFDDPGLLKAFDKEFRKRLHKYKADDDAILPSSCSQDHGMYVPPKGTKKTSYPLSIGPQGPRHKRLKVTE